MRTTAVSAAHMTVKLGCQQRLQQQQWPSTVLSMWECTMVVVPVAVGFVLRDWNDLCVVLNDDLLRVCQQQLWLGGCPKAI